MILCLGRRRLISLCPVDIFFVIVDLIGRYRRLILVVLAWGHGLETGLFQIGCGFVFVQVAGSLRAWRLGETHVSTPVDLSSPHRGLIFASVWT